LLIIQYQSSFWVSTNLSDLSGKLIKRTVIHDHGSSRLVIMLHLFSEPCLPKPGAPQQPASGCLTPRTCLARARGGMPPGWVGSGGTLECDGKIASRKAFFKKNHIKSCRNMRIPESHPDSWWSWWFCTQERTGFRQRHSESVRPCNTSVFPGSSCTACFLRYCF